MEITKENMPETMRRASRCCRILGNPTAYLLLKVLGTARKTPGVIAGEMKVSSPIVSTTLRYLLNLDMVRFEVKGHFKEYWIRDRKILGILDSLENLVEAMRAKKS